VRQRGHSPTESLGEEPLGEALTRRLWRSDPYSRRCSKVLCPPRGIHPVASDDTAGSSRKVGADSRIGPIGELAGREFAQSAGRKGGGQTRAMSRGRGKKASRAELPRNTFKLLDKARCLSVVTESKGNLHRAREQ
jgi:hypothetical protein